MIGSTHRWRIGALCLLLAVGGAAIACRGTGLRTEVRGSGVVVTEQRPVSGFDRISVSGQGTVHVELTGTELLEVEAEDNVLEVLTIEVVDGRLELGAEPFTSIEPTRDIIYRITAAHLTDVAISGSADLDVATVDGPGFVVSISGSGSVRPSGTTGELAVDISGSGRFLGDALESTTAEVSISGSGEADVRVADSLDASVSGSGVIRYAGSPTTVQKKVSGSGSITQR
jgi:hypothetical protein